MEDFREETTWMERECSGLVIPGGERSMQSWKNEPAVPTGTVEGAPRERRRAQATTSTQERPLAWCPPSGDRHLPYKDLRGARGLEICWESFPVFACLSI